MKILDFVAATSMIIALISVPFVLFLWPMYVVKRNNGGLVKASIISVLIFAISVGIGLCAGWTSARIGHDRVLQELASASDNCQISINGKTAANSKEVLSVLRTLQWVPAHHSNPTKRITIEVYDNTRGILLWLARDSGDPREYWIFFPKYLITANNEIGRIKTSIFDGY